MQILLLSHYINDLTRNTAETLLEKMPAEEDLQFVTLACYYIECHIFYNEIHLKWSIVGTVVTHLFNTLKKCISWITIDPRYNRNFAVYETTSCAAIMQL